VSGTSEHHTGLAVDIVGHDYYYSGHPGSTRAVQAWLKEHCWEYGFILRYTSEKQAITGFTAETWHFRYVGTEVSMDLKDSGLCLEEYLGAHKAR
jgi:D-alanyl-D-alanine carboxypeptidase